MKSKKYDCQVVYKVIKEYKAPYVNGIKIEKGEKVKWFAKKSEWEGWTWCENNTGKSGWVPDKYLEFVKSSALALRSYDASELTVSKGDRLNIFDEENGWFLCENERGKQGWVPKESIRPVVLKT